MNNNEYYSITIESPAAMKGEGKSVGGPPQSMPLSAECATLQPSLSAPSPSLLLSDTPSVQPEPIPALLLQVTREVKAWGGRERRTYQSWGLCRCLPRPPSPSR